MTDVPVVVVVSEVAVHGVGVELDLGAGVRGGLPGVLGVCPRALRTFGSGTAEWLAEACRAWRERRRWRAVVQSQL